MSVLLLRLAGPMQAWGDSSRFNHRGTRREPTKSGVVGLLAAASGRRRTDAIEDLASLGFGVRTDQIGKVERDFQTEIDWRNNKSKPLTYRDYLTDAIFTVAVEGPRSVLEGLADVVQRPAFPLYLGRRAFQPTGRIVLGIEEKPLEDALREAPWQASTWYRKRQPEVVSLPIVRDIRDGEAYDELIPDTPVSFDPRERKHEMRPVVHGWLEIENKEGKRPVFSHDPMSLLGGD